jgi:hypothetical protein
MNEPVSIQFTMRYKIYVLIGCVLDICQNINKNSSRFRCARLRIGNLANSGVECAKKAG